MTFLFFIGKSESFSAKLRTVVAWYRKAQGRRGTRLSQKFLFELAASIGARWAK